ncbi:hypothetical protein [Beijerinckia mobilis]|uniref:hypothetical protein n=1 Tax=Beijerinckia mobilis TaxID=231434 RepID=UPI00273C7989|nr:hypothetical protein [Beijerinckia mobilis]
MEWLNAERIERAVSEKHASEIFDGFLAAYAKLICVKAHMRPTAYETGISKHIDDLLSALTEPTRLRALQIVWDGEEHCV